ncbi:MAG: phosphoenolpyruvate--protein phosphotransferase [Kiritimatiellia bacterium]|nr:phosphoenolpyruvate--protein phosphotransferase [Kiritimatiellia bacterium]
MANETVKLLGTIVAEGLVAGPVYALHECLVEEPVRIVVDAAKIPEQIARFEVALENTRNQLKRLAVQSGIVASNGEEDIFEAHRMVIDDKFFYDSVVARITSKLCNAEYAVYAVLDEFIGMLTRMGDAYIKERALDFQDIRRRLMFNLTGRTAELDQLQLDTPSIIVADEPAPSAIMSLPREHLLGILTRRGNGTSHTAIVARALGIPVIVGARNLPPLATGQTILLDAYRALAIIDPTEADCQRAKDASTEQVAARTRLLALRDKPSRTPDGIDIRLMVNTDQSIGFDNIRTCGADGVGLYRTEYLWLSYGREPTEEEQYTAYTQLVQATAGSLAVLRVLDIGGDKVPGNEKTPYAEANPFLGRRSIRYLLQEPEVFRRQLRAILRAGAHGELAIMLPMVTTLEELHESRQLLDQTLADLETEGIPHIKNPRLGVMIEVPSAAICADEFAPYADFFSIGTNDLTQYTLAVDRGNELIAQLYDPTHHALLKLILNSAQAAARHNIPISVCGEMAGDPIYAMLLIGLGIHHLSMSASLVLPVKEVITTVPHAIMQSFAQDLLAHRYTQAAIRERGTQIIARYAPPQV